MSEFMLMFMYQLNTYEVMNKLLIFLTFILASICVNAQDRNESNTANNSIFLFTICNGVNNDVYISEIFELKMDRGKFFSENKERFDKIKKIVIDQGLAKEIQTGLEKNYLTYNQAQNERDIMVEDYKNQKYKVTSFKVQNL